MKSSAERRHAHMVCDKNRTIPLLHAVTKVVQPDDVVIDIGTGIGVLAIAAAKAGAKKVWAIDCDIPALGEAKRRAKKAGVDDKISFVHDLSFDFIPKKRADVILCETVGSFAFDENILATILDAKHRLLKKGGRIVPERVELWGAPISRIPRLSFPAEIGIVKRGDLLAHPMKLACVDFSKKFADRIHMCHKFKCNRRGLLRAIAVWPESTWRQNEITNASPLAAPTHWKQGILVVEERPVSIGQCVSFDLIVKPNPIDPKRRTERLWRCF